MKVWKDVDEVIKMIHDLEDEKLRELDREMKKKPKFDRSKKDNQEVYCCNKR